MFLEWHGNHGKSMRLLPPSFSGNMGQLCWRILIFISTLKWFVIHLNKLCSSVCKHLERSWAEFRLLICLAPSLRCDKVMWIYGYEHGMKYQLCCLLMCDVTRSTFLNCVASSSSPEMEKHSYLPGSPWKCTDIYQSLHHSSWSMSSVPWNLCRLYYHPKHN